MYDSVTQSQTVNTEEGTNHCQLAESTFSNTYESIATGVYNEVAAPHKPDTQVRRFPAYR